MTAQNDGRQVAAVDGQAGMAGQCEDFVVSPTNVRGIVASRAFRKTPSIFVFIYKSIA